MIDSSIFSEAKLVEVTPIFKKDNPLLEKNFHSVSVLLSLSKVFDKLLPTQMQSHIDILLNERISAFRAGLSNQHPLLSLVEKWSEAVNNKKLVGAVLVDFPKCSTASPILC